MPERLPHQLPIQLAAADRIAQLRGHLHPQLWRVRYEPRLRQLRDILQVYTPAERAQARDRVTDRQNRLLDELFDGKWDLR